MVKSKQNITMDDLLKDVEINNVSVADVIEGTVVNKQKNEIWLDIGHLGIGVISRREFTPGFSVELGQTLTVSVIHAETKHGYVILSLRRAMKEKSWEEIQKIYDNNQIVTVYSYDANRGGLLVELEGVRGFLPISQLSISNYPRVNSADKDEILNKLNQLVNKPIQVCILDLNRRENKLIFSEREALKETVSEQLKKLNIGDIVEGTVTGAIDFGVFININGVEGLIHISEISWGRVEDPRKHVTVGETVKVKVIAIDNERVALSLKQLIQDPWEQEIENLKEGSEVEGTVTRITPYGAFVRISPVIEALLYLIHESQEESETTKPRQVKSLKNSELEKIRRSIKVGETKKFIIESIDKTGRRIALKLK